MAFLLVTASPRRPLLDELRRALAADAYAGMQPFGRALTHGLRNARMRPDGDVAWEEEDYCDPPLAEERAAVLDRFFDDIRVERVPRGEGWRRVDPLPPLFPGLADGFPDSLRPEVDERAYPH